MILITGANGTAGRAVIPYLVEKGALVRAMVSNSDSARSIERLGVQPFVGDMRNTDSLQQALAGVSMLYHIGPALMAEELDVGRDLISLARDADIDRFVLHGVSYPYAPDIRFHWVKMELEAELLKSGLAYTVIRPTQFMQNITWSLPEILKSGEFALPYAPDKKMGFVHIGDLGNAVARVLLEEGHEGATYELCSTPRPIDRREMAEILSEAFGTHIRATRCSIDDLSGSHFFASLTAGQRRQLANMYDHIDQFGTPYFNSDVLEMLTGVPTTSYSDFISKIRSNYST